jgi:ATP-binding cassette subfamily C (CFTR/MRP) protein 1
MNTVHVAPVDASPVAEASPKGQEASRAGQEPGDSEVSEQERASWYQWVFYSWVRPMLHRGSERMRERMPFRLEDMLKLPSFEDPEVVTQWLDAAWQAELAARPQHPSLANVLWRTFRGRIIIGGIFRFISDASAFGSPFLLKYFTLWLEGPMEDVWVGYVYAVALALVNVLMSVTLAAGSHFTLSAFSQMQHALTVMIFDSTLRYKHSHGRTGNLLSTYNSDTMKLLELAMFIHGVWVSPMLVIGALVAIYFFIGWAGLIGVGLMVATTPLQGVIMAEIFKFRRLQMKRMDERVTTINEALQGIRICKFMNWELSFVARIGDTREREVAVLRKMYTFRVIQQVIFNSMPQVLNFSLFAIAYGLDHGSIKASNVFPALSMLNVIRIPMMFIPMSIGKLLETKVSMERIQKVLMYNERRNYVTVEPAVEGAAAIEVHDATVTGDADAVILDSVGVIIPRGKLTIIVGPTASGKSSLIGAMVGEADTKPGAHVIHRGTMAYVPQDAWIQNATVRNNILFAAPFDEEYYIDTLLACQLMMDLKQLKASDATSIGERGINLSGGQKQRVALARAVYSRRDIVIMDDPLSAVDPHVCKAIFDDCIAGIMAGRTRVLVTHQVQFLPSADHIIVMDHCRIVFQGTYAEYVRSDAARIDTDAQAAAPAQDEDAHGKVALTEREVPPPSEDALASTEEAQFGDIAWATYKWYIELGTWGRFVLTILASVAWTASTVLFNLFLAWWASKKPVGGRVLSDDEFIMWFGILCGICIILIFFRQFFYSQFALRVATAVHNALVVNILRAPMYFFDTTPIGRITNRFTKDIEVIDFKISESSLMAINLGFNVLSMVVLVCVAQPYLTIMFPFLCVIFYHLYKFYTQTVRGIKRLDGIYRSPMMDLMGEITGGLASIRVYNMAQTMSREHLRRVQTGVRPAYGIRMAQRWLGVRTELLGSIIVLATTIFSVATITNDTSSWNIRTNPAEVALALTYALACTNAITFLTRTAGDLESDMSATERVKEYTDSIPQERDVTYGNGPDQPHAPAAGWPAQPAVTFDDLSLRYREKTPLVLRHVSFHVEAGHRVGVVGRTGSGKSTLMLALFRMVEPASGRILIDNRDTQTLTLSDLREAITIIPQDPVLFSGTIRTNLDPFTRRKDEELWDVIERVGLGDRLRFGATGDAERAGKSDAPVGLDVEVADKGANFSVGQRQLICLARALLKKTKILLMDEATASVDFDTDALIQTTVRSAFKHATVLTIAHRLATVIDSDRILVMNDGLVKEYAAPSKLLDDTGTQFHDMVRQLGAEQFEQLKAVAEGRVSFTDKLRDLVLMEKSADSTEPIASTSPKQKKPAA